MDHALKSIPGRRPNNEDRCRIEIKDDGTALLVLSDGMGGHAAGEVAGQMTVDTIAERFFESPRTGSTDFLENAIVTANLNIHRMASTRPCYAGMGSTVVCAVLSENKAYCANVGDSRLYALRDGALELITHDHSLVQELIDIGKLSPEDAETHPMRNVITRSVGSAIRIEPTFYTFETLPGDRILLCSDGLSGVLSVSEMQSILSEDTSASDIAEKLVSAAYDSGSRDNISVCLAFIPEIDQ